MRKDALTGWFILAMALIWLSVIPGRVAANWTPAGCAPPVGGLPYYYAMPAAPMRQAAPSQPQWQGAAPPAYLASGVSPQPLQAKVRGVSAEVKSTPKFALPSPEALGVRVSASPTPATVQVDWKQIQSRMERLGVLRYQKNALSQGVAVSMLLPTGDPALGQPVEAQAETEAAAILLALDAAEAWARKR